MKRSASAALGVLVVIFSIFAFGCAAGLFQTEEIAPVTVDKACGEELALPVYTGSGKDTSVTIRITNRGSCEVELVERPPAPAAEKSLIKVSSGDRGAVTVAAPAKDKNAQWVVKCARREVDACKADVVVVPQRDVKTGSATFDLSAGAIKVEGEKGSCERKLHVFDFVNETGKSRTLTIEAKNTGDCPDFQVAATFGGKDTDIFTPAVKKGGQASKTKIDVGKGKITFTARCEGALSAPEGKCKGEVTITLQ